MLQLDDPKIENIIKITFDSEIQHKRVRKELQGISSLHQKTYKTSVQPTQLGLKINIEVLEEALLETIKDPVKITFPVAFEIYLDKKFPFVSPRLYCKSDFFKPSFADGRDFLDDVVEQQWTPAILLKDVLVMLIKWIKKINRISSSEEASDLGKYYLEKVYDFDDFLVMNSVAVFPAQEVINDQGKTEDRFITVSDSYFLCFTTQDKNNPGSTLLSYSKIKSIANIKKNKENPKTLVFTFHDKSKKSGVTQTMFILDDASKLIELVIDVGQRYGMKINRTVNKPQDLTLAEVTAKSYENIDIEELLEDITLFESRLENDISVDVINILMALYQKTIEYFSAFNDPAFSDFVDRLHSLLKRKDVQVILQSQEEHNQPTTGSKSRKDKKYEDEEEEKKEDSSNPQHRYEDEENLQPNIHKQNPKISLKEGGKGSHDSHQYAEDLGNEGVGIDLGEHA